MTYVKDKVSKSHILKEKFKREIMDDKFQRMKDIKETEKKLEIKLQKIQSEIESIENNIAEVEVAKGLGKQQSNVADLIIKKYGEELEGRLVFYEDIEKEIDDLGKDKNWLNWVEKYGETLELNTSNEEKQKDFLKGVLNQIIIKSEYGMNRDGKEVQVGHSVDFLFKMKIIDDDFRWVDKSSSPQKYEVIQGKNTDSSGVMRFVSKRSRSPKKKAIKG